MFYPIVFGILLLALAFLATFMCADEEPQKTPEMSASTKKKQAPPPPPPPHVPKKKAEKVAAPVSVSGKVCTVKKEKSAARKVAKVAKAPETAVTEIKSTGEGYYAMLCKQTRVKSVSQYGMPPV